MTVTPFTAAHLHAVCDLEQALFDRPLTAANLSILSVGTAFRGFIMRAGDASATAPVTGYLLMHVHGDEAEILSIGTAPDWQRQGIAAELIRNAIAELRPEGVAHLFLEVAVDNPPALALYETMEFTQVGRRSGYYQRDGGRCDALVLRHDL